MAFIDDDFLLRSELAKKLYHEVAAKQPIIDYHCHLEAEKIYQNKRFLNIVDLWLEGDHYKWRAMRANGISESKITGTASKKEKFHAWAQTVESSIANPLYHWSHLELKYYFGIDELLNGDNWEMIYNKTNDYLQLIPITTQHLITNSKVAQIGTTDNPTDSLNYHRLLQQTKDFQVKVTPSFRADVFFNLNNSTLFQSEIKRLEEQVDFEVKNYQALLSALIQRIDIFDELGCIASDHGFETLFFEESTNFEIEVIFQKSLSNHSISEQENAQWQTRLLFDLSKEYSARSWAMQIHFGVIRNNNKKMLLAAGGDIGFDSMTDQSNLGTVLNSIFNKMTEADHLPKTIIYNLNPIYNDLVACTIANFQENNFGVKSKMQFGSGWWFNDTKRGILRQLEALADQGLLMNFVGMVTDSRSFLSYSRHEYFRRILCDFVASKVNSGEFPDDYQLLEKMVSGICYQNASNYFSKL